MPLQDLTPQLRTRLNRMERAVGWFIMLATLLLIFGFGYYIYKTAENKGWFLKKMNYHTGVSSAAGLKVGQPVRLMGFDVGVITHIELNEPYKTYNIIVNFDVKEPYFGYIWSDSTVKVAAGDFLGNRYLEITKGIQGLPTILESTNKTPIGMLLKDKILKPRRDELSKEFTNEVALLKKMNEEAKQTPANYYTNLTGTSIYWLPPDEAPALTERAEQVISQVQAALPNFLALTNQLYAVLANATRLTSNATVLTANLNDVADNLHPAISNLTLITANLRNPKGSLGDWLIPTNLNLQLETTLRSADGTLNTLDTNLLTLNQSLDNLAGITSNLNHQVQVNSNILANISDIVVHTDEFVQGMKHFWLFRSAFKTPKTNAPASSSPPGQPLLSPKAKAGG